MPQPRKTVSLRAVLALATLFAMLIAPLCGPLCAAGVCARPSGSAESCHEAVTASGAGVPDFGIAAVKACNLNELPAAKLTERLSRAPGTVRTVLLFLNPYPTAASWANHKASAELFAPPCPPASPFDTGALTVLRI